MQRPERRAREEAKVRRNRAVSMAAKRKEEYIGARVPKALKEQVIEHAHASGIPVSILIRRILEEAFGEAEANAPSASSKQGGSSDGAERFPQVLGWEAIRLNKTMDCSGCGRELASGQDVLLGLAGAGEAHVVLCDRCKESV